MSIDYSKFPFPKPPKTEKKKREPIKGKKHTQTKKTDIPTKTKVLVWERDRHKCIFCGEYVDWNYACCHYIPRSAGGLGIPQNIFTACEKCHSKQDNGFNTIEMTKKAGEYLKNIYGKEWNEEELIFKKYK